jgi:transposase InsO family protein
MAKDRGLSHVRGAPCHPQTQCKIERWHQTLKNRKNYYLPGDFEAQIARFVQHYNHQGYHESLRNLTPAEVYHPPGTRKDQTRHHQTATIENHAKADLNSSPQSSQEPPF